MAFLRRKIANLAWRYWRFWCSYRQCCSCCWIPCAVDVCAFIFVPPLSEAIPAFCLHHRFWYCYRLLCWHTCCRLQSLLFSVTGVSPCCIASIHVVASVPPDSWVLAVTATVAICCADDVRDFAASLLLQVTSQLLLASSLLLLLFSGCLQDLQSSEVPVECCCWGFPADAEDLAVAGVSAFGDIPGVPVFSAAAGRPCYHILASAGIPAIARLILVILCCCWLSCSCWLSFCCRLSCCCWVPTVACGPGVASIPTVAGGFAVNSLPSLADVPCWLDCQTALIEIWVTQLGEDDLKAYALCVSVLG